ncbi:hypothetical protein Tco_0247494 [Tanacetum coccineum]
MESLHLSFQRVVDAGLFTGINLNSSLTLSHMFYADDAVFLGQWNDGYIDTLVNVLECFYRVSGLRINMSKSKIMGCMLRGIWSRMRLLNLGTSFSKLRSFTLALKLEARCLGRKTQLKEVKDEKEIVKDYVEDNISPRHGDTIYVESITTNPVKKLSFYWNNSIRFSLSVDLNIKYPEYSLAEDSSALVLQALRRSSSIFTPVYVAKEFVEIESFKSSAQHSVNDFVVINIPEEDVETKQIILDPDDQPMWESAKTVAPTPNSATVQIEYDDNFVINSTHLNMIRENKFDGYLRADPHDHIREFLTICNMFRYDETQSEAVKLLIFPFPCAMKLKPGLTNLMKSL